MEATEILGLAAGICTSGAAIPQIVTTIKKKEAKQVSPVMFAVLMIGNGLWVYYGIHKDDLPIIITNCLSVTFDLIMLFLKFRYRDNA
ncbi:SemiSWEET family sugar transporter [Mucilaginibacter myungsuensis]|uniref:SemiSWEET transporter n=1 Tax=Mucilaginibacter myungsuensis TaxID=649104 RepID=A0A929KZ67_9SPHI|nr:SemiSWEET transporter [Mucilaginibacter myungsuensis]MBE9662633.1 SemiSWEET transporter [Mucilaginibacter myungsuensis]MDN3598053.1 SemiSWEET transporter [Mucilaginibacter myungsuensis]